MRIAIIIIGNTRRSSYLNGYSIRYGGGGASGTDTSSILVGEYLAKQGHEVVIVTDKLDDPLEQEFKNRGEVYVPGSISYGVTYTNIDFEGVKNKTFDVLINMLWFDKYKELPIKVTKSIVYWAHMQWVYGTEELRQFAIKNNISVGVVNVSGWQKKMSQGTIDYLKNNYNRVRQLTISNPIFDEMIKEVNSTNPQKKKGKFIFHATWPTGGTVALDAVKQVNIEGKEFHALDYFISVDHSDEKWFYNHKGCDRKTVFSHLAESEYFIYPLWTIHQVVRRDTFACTVAEALAMGTIVLTYPLGALPEVFKDCCVWLDAPPGVDLDYLQSQDLARDENNLFKYTKNIVDKIHYLEKNPDIKEHYKNVGKKYIMDNYNIEKIGKVWVNFLNELTNI